MPLNKTSAAAAANSAIDAQIQKLINGDPENPVKSNADMAKDLAAAYHNYAKAATLLGADMTSGGTVTLLESAFVSDNTTGMAAKIAQGICDYWSSFDTPALLPKHGGTSVVSVVVNGTAVVAAMTAAIAGLVKDTASPDGWLDFFTATENVVKTIPCVITEMMPGSPPFTQAWPETIS